MLSALPFNWGSFLYFFVVGTATFGFFFWFPLHTGDASWGRREDRITFLFLLIGFLFYVALFLFWQLYAIEVI